jgi:hypothetical protein
MGRKTVRDPWKMFVEMHRNSHLQIISDMVRSIALPVSGQARAAAIIFSSIELICSAAHLLLEHK